jgi:hypothetical protein
MLYTDIPFNLGNRNFNFPVLVSFAIIDDDF